jgi:hypothetical protein
MRKQHDDTNKRVNKQTNGQEIHAFLFCRPACLPQPNGLPNSSNKRTHAFPCHTDVTTTTTRPTDSQKTIKRARPGNDQRKTENKHKSARERERECERERERVRERERERERVRERGRKRERQKWMQGQLGVADGNPSSSLLHYSSRNTEERWDDDRNVSKKQESCEERLILLLLVLLLLLLLISLSIIQSSTW